MGASVFFGTTRSLHDVLMRLWRRDHPRGGSFTPSWSLSPSPPAKRPAPATAIPPAAKKTNGLAPGRRRQKQTAPTIARDPQEYKDMPCGSASPAL